MLTVFVTMALCPLKSAHPAQKELNPTTILSKTQTDAALPIVLPPPSSQWPRPRARSSGSALRISEESPLTPTHGAQILEKALTRSPIGLDLYLWLNYRTFGLERPFQLTWPQLYRQFGADPAQATDKNIVNSFRTKALRELKKIKIAWPGLDYATPAGVLELRPSEPSVPSRQLRLLPR